MKLVVAAIIVDSLRVPTRVLAARRKGPPALVGKWEFPGGKVEDSETPQKALLRELEEELSVQVLLGEELMAIGGAPWKISDKLEMRLWYAEVAGGEPRPVDSHDALRWLNEETLTSVEWLEADQQVLPHIFACK